MSRARWAAALALLVWACGGGGPQEIPGPEPMIAPAPDIETEEAAPEEPAMAAEPEPEMPAPPEPEPLPEEPPAMEPDTLPSVAAPEPMPAVTPEPQVPDLGPNAIGPGMTETQVRQALGTPLYTSAYGDHTFFFYDNSREKQAGFLDFVIFRNGRVVDAVFRDPARRYAGNSSSPPGVRGIAQRPEIQDDHVVWPWIGVTPKPTPGGERLTVPPPPRDTVPAPPR